MNSGSAEVPVEIGPTALDAHSHSRPIDECDRPIEHLGNLGLLDEADRERIPLKAERQWTSDEGEVTLK